MSAQSAWSRAEDAQREAKAAAAMIAKRFEAMAIDAGDDSIAMFAAIGFEDQAYSIFKHLDVMFDAVDELQREVDELKGKAAPRRSEGGVR